jgi:hypothetical protein
MGVKFCQNAKKVKREYSVKIFSFFLEKKVARFWEERLECFSLHLDSDFSLVTFLLNSLLKKTTYLLTYLLTYCHLRLNPSLNSLGMLAMMQHHKVSCHYEMLKNII